MAIFYLPIPINLNPQLPMYLILLREGYLLCQYLKWIELK